jgi:hypothetical protein
MTNLRKLIRKSLFERSAATIDYNCLMVDVAYPEWRKILDKIDPKDVYDEPGFGLEKNPHVTVLYGLHETVKFKTIKDFIIKHATKPVELEGLKISHFKSKEYDVVKIDVRSKDLSRLNNLVTKEFPYTSDFPEYHPHITIGYVKKGFGKKYDQELKAIKLTASKFSYSYPNKKASDKFSV